MYGDASVEGGDNLVEERVHDRSVVEGGREVRMDLVDEKGGDGVGMTKENGRWSVVEIGYNGNRMVFGAARQAAAVPSHSQLGHNLVKEVEWDLGHNLPFVVLLNRVRLPWALG